MSKSILLTALRFILLLAVQVLILNNINLFGLMEPLLYVWFILLLPLRTPKWAVLLLSFLMGFCVDIFSGQVGFHTAVSVFTGFIRPLFLGALLTNSHNEAHDTPTSANMGFMPYLGYVSILMIIHTFTLIAIESLHWSEILQYLLRSSLSSLAGIVLILICDMVFFPSSKN